MKIKIGNFNFINNKENKLHSFNDLTYSNNYFYLDGKEDTLFVLSNTEFEKEKYELPIPEFEKNLLKKFSILPFYKDVVTQINNYIENTVNSLIENQNYSKYNLYKNIDFNIIAELEKNAEFNIYYDSLEFDFDTNRINIGDYIYNPYTEKVDNIEECFAKNKFKEQIKNRLILKEIENGIAPKFVTEILKINEFLKDKKTVNVIIENTEKFKMNSYISGLLELRDNKITMDPSYNTRDNFEKENPGKNIEDLKLEDLKGLIYGKNMLEIDSFAFEDISLQTINSTEDKLLRKIDNLKEEINDDYHKLREEYTKNNRNNKNYFPWFIYETVSELTQIESRNKQRNEGKLDGELEKMPDYYTEELKYLLKKKELVDYLEKVENIEDIKEVCKELGDNELQRIYYELKDDEENSEDEDEMEV